MKTYFNELCNKNEPSLYCCSEVINIKEHYKRLMHSHPDVVEIIIVTNGFGEYSIDGKIYQINKGDLIVLNSFVAHEELLISATNVTTYCCSIKGLKKRGFRNNALIPDNVSPVFPLEKNTAIVEHYMILIHLLLKNKQSKEAQDICISLLEFLETVILNKVTIYSEREHDDLLIQVKEYIEYYYYEDLNLEKLAALVNISPYYLAHQFKEKFLCSPVQYLIKRRIGEAQTLLETTSEKNVDIAYQVGFNTCSHFQTTFKKHAGITPKQYRKKYQTI